MTKTPPPFARVEELGESNVALRYFCWVDQREADWFKVRSEAIRRTKVALDLAGIELPVPIYQVNLRESKGPPPKRTVDATHMDRTAHEVTVDDYIEEQIEADRRLSPDRNDLLTNQ